jgi:hypothetical protein
MRALIALLAAFSVESGAAPAIKDSPLLTVTVKSRYSTQTTRVYKEKSEWICRTELSPYHPSSKVPVSPETLAKVFTANQFPDSARSNCHDVVAVIDRTDKQPKESIGCANDPAYTRLLKEIDANCGRN